MRYEKFKFIDILLYIDIIILSDLVIKTKQRKTDLLQCVTNNAVDDFNFFDSTLASRIY